MLFHLINEKKTFIMGFNKLDQYEFAGYPVIPNN